MVAINRKVKDFKLPATGDQQIRLKDYQGKIVVLYFYPKDNTPGCTNESIDFSALHSHFKRQGAVVFGVSRDSVKSHENFKAKFDMPFELISDADQTLCDYFDVMHEKSMYGRKYLGLERSTFVIDGDGKLRHEWRKVKVKGHAQEVLETVTSLNKSN